MGNWELVNLQRMSERLGEKTMADAEALLKQARAQFEKARAQLEQARAQLEQARKEEAKAKAAEEAPKEGYLVLDEEDDLVLIGEVESNRNACKRDREVASCCTTCQGSGFIQGPSGEADGCHDCDRGRENRQQYYHALAAIREADEKKAREQRNARRREQRRKKAQDLKKG